MTPRTYATPEAFKKALDDRIKKPRDRQLLVFQRYLARLVGTFGEQVVLKGGFALELRLQGARSTRDIDLRAMGSSEGLLGRLQEAGMQDLGDRMVFQVEPDAKRPLIEEVRYQGQRFTVRCLLAARPYGEPFGLDVAFGDPLCGPPDRLTLPDTLAFIGIQPPQVSVYPVSTHIAEKLHAYTRPLGGTNSRVKDLPDLALLAQVASEGKALDAGTLRAAIQQTFGFRGTHEAPSSLPDPPTDWMYSYADMAREDNLPWPDLAKVTAAARAFLDPVLEGDEGTWDPASWTWLPA